MPIITKSNSSDKTIPLVGDSLDCNTAINKHYSFTTKTWANATSTPLQDYGWICPQDGLYFIKMTFQGIDASVRTKLNKINVPWQM